MPSPYAAMTIEEIRAAMNARFGQGDAYHATLPWDVLRHDHLHRELAIQIEQAVRTHDATSPLRVLDVGCGIKPALLHPFVVDVLSGFPVDALLIDLSDEAVRRVQDEALPRLRSLYPAAVGFEARQMAAESLGAIQGPEFDIAVSVESIEHWSDVERGLDGVRSCLAAGGSFVLTTPNRDALHVRMGRKLGVDVPFCASDHVYEFGWNELDSISRGRGFRVARSGGVGLTPYWALEHVLGPRMRELTDRDLEVISWLDSIGSRAPEFAFCQVKTLVVDR